MIVNACSALRCSNMTSFLLYRIVCGSEAAAQVPGAHGTWYESQRCKLYSYLLVRGTKCPVLFGRMQHISDKVVFRLKYRNSLTRAASRDLDF